jgi:hypothetical protein
MLYSGRCLVGSLWATPKMIQLTKGNNNRTLYISYTKYEMETYSIWVRLIPLTVVPLSGTHCIVIAQLLGDNSKTVIKSITERR